MQNSDNKNVVWVRRHAQYRFKSGLSRREFCEKRRLKRSTLDYSFCRLG